jgi:hypothetical protein
MAPRPTCKPRATTADLEQDDSAVPFADLGHQRASHHNRTTKRSTALHLHHNRATKRVTALRLTCALRNACEFTITLRRSGRPLSAHRVSYEMHAKAIARREQRSWPPLNQSNIVCKRLSSEHNLTLKSHQAPPRHCMVNVNALCAMVNPSSQTTANENTA